jgi:hypothetical protein
LIFGKRVDVKREAVRIWVVRRVAAKRVPKMVVARRVAVKKAVTEKALAKKVVAARARSAPRWWKWRWCTHIPLKVEQPLTLAARSRKTPSPTAPKSQSATRS